MLEDPHAVALGREPVRVDGTVAGRVVSGGYGYATGRSIAYASLPPDIAAAASDVHVEIEGTWVAAEIATGPLHRPAVAEAAA